MTSKRNPDRTEERPANPANDGAPSAMRFGLEQPHIIHPSAVYMVDDLRRFFGLKASSVRREVRFGRIRMAKRCGRYFCLGQWVLEWIEGGELKFQAGAEGTAYLFRKAQGDINELENQKSEEPDNDLPRSHIP